MLTENRAVDGEDVSSKSESSVDDSLLAKAILKYICKFHVPNNNRELCLAMLRKMNIHHGSLFPDPGGASRYCNDWLLRYIADNKRDEEERAKAEEVLERPKFDATQLAHAPGGDAEHIRTILRAVLGAEAPVELIVADWADKIARHYQEIAPLDWPAKPSGIARVKTSLNRQLSIFGVSAMQRDEAVGRIVEMLKKSYRSSAQHSPTPA